MQVKPVTCGNSVTDRVTGVGMQDHFGIANCTGGEIDQTGIIATRLRASERGRGLYRNRVVISPVFTKDCVRAASCNQDSLCYRWALVAHLIQFVSAFLISNKGPRLCHFGANL